MNRKLKNFLMLRVLECLIRRFGEELTNHYFDLKKSYKSGMCFFNVKTGKVQCTKQILKSLADFNTNTGCIDQIARYPTLYLKIYIIQWR